MSEVNPDQQKASEGLNFEEGEFASLLKKEFKPKSDRAQEAVESAVQTLAEQVLSDTALISDDAIRSIESMIAAIDNVWSRCSNSYQFINCD